MAVVDRENRMCNNSPFTGPITCQSLINITQNAKSPSYLGPTMGYYGVLQMGGGGGVVQKGREI